MNTAPADTAIYTLCDSYHIGPGPHGVDTEGTPANPWCTSIAPDPQNGFVVRAGGEITVDPDALFVCHNALWDLPVLKSLGIEPPQFTDTMIAAFLLGFEFVGLKKLAGLLLGKDRESYRDVMEEANERIARAWLTEQIADFPRWPGAKPPDFEKTLRLVDRMLAKEEGARTLRERWHDCRAREVLQEDLGLLGEMPSATMDDLPLEDAVAYAAEDAVDTVALYPILDQRIDEMGLRDCLNVDLAIVPMIVRMHEVGIKADAQHFRDLSQLYADEAAQMAREIKAMGGPDNPGSGEIKDWLFGTLRLPSKKKTKGGDPSTDKKAMDALLKNPKITGKGRKGLELLMEWRQVMKLKGTYADPMPGFIGADGRLHPNLSLTKTATGRLAAKEPNILAFPKHSERGKLIRAGFIADEGCEFGEWDLSQIELCILAIDSGDERMLAEIRSGVDKHTSTAAAIFRRDVKELQAAVNAKDHVAKEQRFAAKAVNFGIVMGITEYGLLDQFQKQGSTRGVETVWNHVRECFEERVIHWTLEDCAELIANWRETYPQAAAYLAGKHLEALRTGYVRDMWGRIRYIPDIDSPNEYFREAAKREAQATPVQSGAQGLEKRLMVEVWKRLPGLWAKGIRVECLLQVHDSLLFEYQKDARPLVDKMMRDSLAVLQKFPIEIKMESSYGDDNWAEL